LLAGSVVCLFGVFVAFMGATDILAGHLFSHVGGVVALTYGLLSAAFGFWLVRRGLRIFRSVESSAG